MPALRLQDIKGFISSRFGFFRVEELKLLLESCHWVYCSVLFFFNFLSTNLTQFPYEETIVRKISISRRDIKVTLLCPIPSGNQFPYHCLLSKCLQCNSDSEKDQRLNDVRSIRKKHRKTSKLTKKTGKKKKPVKDSPCPQRVLKLNP